jgi:hypothetical protein
VDGPCNLLLEDSTANLFYPDDRTDRLAVRLAAKAGLTVDVAKRFLEAFEAIARKTHRQRYGLPSLMRGNPLLRSTRAHGMALSPKVRIRGRHEGWRSAFR